MRPFDIYDAVFTWRGCADMRPWLLLSAPSGGVLRCLPIASECYGASCFQMMKEDPDFAATGLKKSCHIIDSYVYQLAMGDLRRRRGELNGDLRRRFRQFSGL